MEKIRILQGDITQMDVDAIVNAANTSLLGGGGVDGAIHLAAGPELLKECEKLGGCPTGEARITKGYNLIGKYVIHTVGPVWRDGNSGESAKLKNSYVNSLKLAYENKIESIAFPNISTGVYRFPKRRAARIALDTTISFLKEFSFPKIVYFVCFDDDNLEIYKELLNDRL